MSTFKNSLIPFLKFILGFLFFITFLMLALGGVIVYFSPETDEKFFTVFSVGISSVLTFFSFKIMISGWRSYFSTVGTFSERHIKGKLKVEEIKTKIELCDEFGIEISWRERTFLSLSPETLKELENKIIKQKEEEERIKQELEEEEERIKQELEEEEERIKQEKARIRDGLRDKLIKTSFDRGEICRDMPMNAVDFIYGPKFEQKKGESGQGKTLKCKYGRGEKNRAGYYTYELEVTYKNGNVERFKEL